MYRQFYEYTVTDKSTDEVIEYTIIDERRAVQTILNVHPTRLYELGSGTIVVETQHFRRFYDLLNN